MGGGKKIITKVEVHFKNTLKLALCLLLHLNPTSHQPCQFANSPINFLNSVLNRGPHSPTPCIEDAIFLFLGHRCCHVKYCNFSPHPYVCFIKFLFQVKKMVGKILMKNYGCPPPRHPVFGTQSKKTFFCWTFLSNDKS